MNGKRVKVIISALLLAVFLSSCIGVNRNFRNVRNDLLDQLDAKYTKEVEFSVGGGTLLFASLVAGIADVEHEGRDIPADKILRQIDRVQIGVYTRKYDHIGKRKSSKKNYVNNLAAEMRENGWENIVKTVDNNEVVAVFVRFDEDYEELRQLFVVAAERSEVVLVEVTGDLNDVIDIALQEADFEFADWR